MDAAEVKQYKQQLAEVRTALKNDGENEELRALEAELENLIQLLTGSVTSTSSSLASSKEPEQEQIQERRYAVGNECQAKYQADGRWYPARVVAVGGSTSSPMYTVLFKGYNETEIVPASALRITHAQQQQQQQQQQQPSRAPKLSAEEEAERDRKRKRSEKKAERFASRTAEANAVQTSWQKFAKKAEKKGVYKGNKSMFKTPDDPLAKVGVVGAGRGMTQYEERKKHTYNGEEEKG